MRGRLWRWALFWCVFGTLVSIAQNARSEEFDVRWTGHAGVAYVVQHHPPNEPEKERIARWLEAPEAGSGMMGFVVMKGRIEGPPNAIYRVRAVNPMSEPGSIGHPYPLVWPEPEPGFGLGLGLGALLLVRLRAH